MKPTITSQRECRRLFRASIAPEVIARYGKHDRPAMNEAFNDWTDMLCKDGQITERAYNRWTRR